MYRVWTVRVTVSNDDIPYGKWKPNFLCIDINQLNILDNAIRNLFLFISKKVTPLVFSLSYEAIFFLCFLSVSNVVIVLHGKGTQKLW
jgi:hypothetical protein